MISNLIPSVIGAVVFGSYGRGDFDDNSDLDLLIVVRDGSGTTPESKVVELLSPLLPKKPSVSFYGEQKLYSLFEEGNLFAWHLFLEGQDLRGWSSRNEIIREPKPYRTSLEDITGLQTILSGVPEKIDLMPHNATFEMGILYVCARNIAMSASWHLKSRPDFTRYAPFEISPRISFPLSREQYDLTMKCRMASTRGTEPPRVDKRTVKKTWADINAWAQSVSNYVSASR